GGERTHRDGPDALVILFELARSSATLRHPVTAERDSLCFGRVDTKDDTIIGEHLRGFERVVRGWLPAWLLRECGRRQQCDAKIGFTQTHHLCAPSSTVASNT